MEPYPYLNICFRLCIILLRSLPWRGGSIMYIYFCTVYIYAIAVRPVPIITSTKWVFGE